MSSVWLYPFIIVAGILQAVGAVMNAQLRNYLVNPWLASFVSFVLIAFFFASMFAIIPRPLPPVSNPAAQCTMAPPRKCPPPRRPGLPAGGNELAFVVAHSAASGRSFA
ncbi:MAG: DMT family transporter [Rhodomicrobium sp.]